LANNTMAQQGSVMLVGDAKQSIYRWRGGEVEQFLDLYSDKDRSNKIEQGGEQRLLYKRSTILLGDNWRSKSEIVNFNNSFFESVVDLKDKNGFRVGNPEHRQLFKEARQAVRAGEGGLVSIDILEDAGIPDQYIDQQSQYIINYIQEALASGYLLNDICILSRSKKHNSVLSGLLAVKDIPVVSSDSLLLGQSEKARIIVAFLKLAQRPDDQWSRLIFLEWFWSTYQERTQQTDGYVFVDSWMDAGLGKWEELLQLTWEDFSWLRFRHASLINKVQMVIEGFRFEVQNDPFLQNFMDHALDFEDGKEEGESEFLRWWDMKGVTAAIEMPDDLEAVRLMTIHKAKGLEFPVVIVAFADWLAFREPVPPSTWMMLHPDEFFGLPAAKIGLREMTELPGLEGYNAIFQKHKEDVTLDNLNLLYVALTRACDRLHILGNESWDANQRITVYLRYFLELRGVEGSHWSTGEETVKTNGTKRRSSSQELKTYNSVPWSDRLDVVVDSPRNWQGGESASTVWGKKVHSILSMVEYEDDLDEVLNKMEKQGSFLQEEMEILRELTQRTLRHPELRTYYRQGLRVLNESEILVPQHTSLRPDRLVQEGETYHIIEYKTGKPTGLHQQQVEAYAEILQKQGLKVGDRVLVYLNESLEINKW
ncbi:MAG: UvrD-helicase domain-containing protein, partial [Owenweeksia sp.]